MEDNLDLFEKWKTTSIFLKMEDNLNVFVNGKQTKKNDAIQNN